MNLSKRQKVLIIIAVAILPLTPFVTVHVAKIVDYFYCLAKTTTCWGFLSAWPLGLSLIYGAIVPFISLILMLFAFVPKPKEPIDLNRPLRVTLTILALLVFISWPLLLIAAFNKVEINIPGMNLPSSTVTVICALIVAPPVLGTFLVWLLRKDRIKQK